MAIVTTLAGGTIPGGSAGDDWGFDTILSATANSFSWLSSDGHAVELIGSFTYGNGMAMPPQAAP